MSHRSRILFSKKNKQEELHIFTNPLLDSRLPIHVSNGDDLQAPLISPRLSPNSKWFIVRKSIHKIRSWGGISPSDPNQPLADWFSFFQMSRELRHVQEDIRQVTNRPDFTPVRHFCLPTDNRHKKRFNVSHIQPMDTLYHPAFGHDPMLLQALLYYFSKECVVPHNSIFRPFLSDVCTVISRKREQLDRVTALRKFALALTIIVFLILFLMLFLLLFSALKTTWNLQSVKDYIEFSEII